MTGAPRPLLGGLMSSARTRRCLTPTAGTTSSRKADPLAWGRTPPPRHASVGFAILSRCRTTSTYRRSPSRCDASGPRPGGRHSSDLVEDGPPRSGSCSSSRWARCARSARSTGAATSTTNTQPAWYGAGSAAHATRSRACACTTETLARSARTGLRPRQQGSACATPDSQSRCQVQTASVTTP